MLRIKSNASEVLKKLEKMKNDPMSFILPEFQKKLDNIICPDHGQSPQATESPEGGTKFKIQFCCPKLQEILSEKKEKGEI